MHRCPCWLLLSILQRAQHEVDLAWAEPHPGTGWVHSAWMRMHPMRPCACNPPWRQHAGSVGTPWAVCMSAWLQHSPAPSTSIVAVCASFERDPSSRGTSARVDLQLAHIPCSGMLPLAHHPCPEPARSLQGEESELEQVEQELSDLNKGKNNAPKEAKDMEKRKTNLLVGMLGMLFSQIFLKSFTLTFLAEWGDRSQIATIGCVAFGEAVTGTEGRQKAGQPWQASAGAAKVLYTHA
jgi:hypothetical protein